MKEITSWQIDKTLSVIINRIAYLHNMPNDDALCQYNSMPSNIISAIR